VRGTTERGFTLLELALALAIVAILLGIAIPRLPSLGRTDLEASADRLAATMTYLADEASLRGRIYRLTLDLDAEGWTVAALAPFAAVEDGAPRPEFREDTADPMAGAVGLPDGVVFDAVLDRDGSLGSGTRDVFFLPEGLTESLGVRLAGEGGASVVVSLDAARGSARREETLEER
jgi:prepilin-type N-terminal cleavage/methylation domain-containing protein